MGARRKPKTWAEEIADLDDPTPRGQLMPFLAVLKLPLTLPKILSLRMRMSRTAHWKMMKLRQRTKPRETITKMLSAYTYTGAIYYCRGSHTLERAPFAGQKKLILTHGIRAPI